MGGQKLAGQASRPSSLCRPRLSDMLNVASDAGRREMSKMSPGIGVRPSCNSLVSMLKTLRAQEPPHTSLTPSSVSSRDVQSCTQHLEPVCPPPISILLHFRMARHLSTCMSSRCKEGPGLIQHSAHPRPPRRHRITRQLPGLTLEVVFNGSLCGNKICL